MSDELAQDPASRVYLPLGEALRRQGQMDLALKVAVKGLERHPRAADAHDLLARVLADRKEFERAYDEWNTVLQFAPGHLGALKGIGFICFQRERYADAERYLSAAVKTDPGDDDVAAALKHVRSARRALQRTVDAPTPKALAEDSRFLFTGVLQDEGQTGLLLDSRGLVLAGAYLDQGGNDVAQSVGAELSGMTDSARRATRHLELGDWTSIVFETEAAVVALAPVEGDGLLVVATTRNTALGLVRRLLDQCVDVASRWLRGMA